MNLIRLVCKILINLSLRSLSRAIVDVFISRLFRNYNYNLRKFSSFFSRDRRYSISNFPLFYFIRARDLPDRRDDELAQSNRARTFHNALRKATRSGLFPFFFFLSPSFLFLLHLLSDQWLSNDNRYRVAQVRVATRRGALSRFRECVKLRKEPVDGVHSMIPFATLETAADRNYFRTPRYTCANIRQVLIKHRCNNFYHPPILFLTKELI